MATLPKTSRSNGPIQPAYSAQHSNGRSDLGTPELRAAVATMTDEQRDNALVFLEYNTEELAGLPDGCGIQAVANVRNLLDYLPTLSQCKSNSLF